MIRETKLMIPFPAALLVAACSGTPADVSDDVDSAKTIERAESQLTRSCTLLQLAAQRKEMRATLSAVANDPEVTSVPDFTVLLEAADGRRFTHSSGSFTPNRSYESASTSKWVSAVIVLDLVDRGLLTLDTEAADVLPFWDEPGVTVRHLLSFTSGFSDEAPCVHVGTAGFGNCVRSIYEANLPDPPTPGARFAYSNSHMQIAGLMAIRAAGTTSWAQLWADFQNRTGQFPNGSYALPSTTNPRVAGGMILNGAEYLDFLRALYHGDVLSPATRSALFANQRGPAFVVDSPAWAALGEDWAYGLGNWLECPTATKRGSFDCGDGNRNSSPGAYGAYPFIDFENEYFGIVARQGPLGTMHEGIQIFRAIEDIARRWSTRSC